MKKLVTPLLIGLSAMTFLVGCQTPNSDKTDKSTMNDTDTILGMERAALDRWGKGDPSGFLEISAPDVVYFDSNLERRLDGLAALTALYETVRGKIHLARYELLNPKVQLCGDAAVLTYNFVGYTQDKTSRWNCTEVYRRTGSSWCIIQSHWSVTQHSP